MTNDMEKPVPDDIIKPKAPKKSKKSSGKFKTVLDGSLLTSNYVSRQIPFMLFLVLLAMLYIANTYNAKKIEKRIRDKAKQVNELKAEYITLTSELVYNTRRTNIELLSEQQNMGLDWSEEPSVIIETTKE